MKVIPETHPVQLNKIFLLLQVYSKMFILNKDKDRLRWSTKLHCTIMIGSPEQGQSQSVIYLLPRKLQLHFCKSKQLHFCKSKQRHSITYKCKNAPKGIQCNKTVNDSERI